MTFVQVNHLYEVTHRKPTAVAIGSFDGVHLGHQAVLREMVASTKREGARSAVLTFFPHPKRVLQGLKGRYYLSTLEERVATLAEFGVDLVITHPFNEEVRRTRAKDFVSQLRQYLDMRQLWGGDFALGYKREGDIATLRRLGETLGYTVELVDRIVFKGGALVSSSRVRRSLQLGDVEDVRLCLNRPYCVSGTVTMGDQRGRAIGFPMASLAEWKEQLLPANGVYATVARVGAQRYLAATNVGVRPTIDGRDVTVEVHLLDFEGELYGQEIKVEFVERVRPEKKFSGLDALKSQIEADVAEIRRLLT